MARSSYIYVVTDGRVGPPVAAFTVKHELSDNPVHPALAERLGMTPSLPRELALEDILNGKQIR